MKYLKLFENHIYYSEIDFEKFTRAVKYHEDEVSDEDDQSFADLGYTNPDKCIDFTDYEFNYILSILPKWHEYNSSSCDIELFNLDKNIQIVKGKDEWFYVKYDQFGDSEFVDYYKCDQFDGLLKCIKEVIL